MRADETSATPAVIQTPPALNFALGAGAVLLPLGNYIAIPGTTGQVVQLNSSLGKINLELRADAAPATVTNFLGYVNSGAYSNLLIHRSMPGFVFQTGGFTLNGYTVDPVQAHAPVVNEFGLSNTRGTVAMAKVGPPEGEDPTFQTINSATNQWFINLADNSDNLDNQNGGFTVFAQVIGTGMDVVDVIEALPTYNVSDTLGPDFTDMPLQAPNLDLSSLVMIDSVKLMPLISVETTNPAVITANVTGATFPASQLVLTPKSAGTAGVTVRASDTSGHIAEFTIIASSSGLTVGPGQVASFRVADGTGPFQWQRLPAGSKVWADIFDTDGYGGTGTSILTVPGNRAASGDQYRCVMTVAGKSKITTAQLLTVQAAAPLVFRYSNAVSIAGAGVVSGTTYFAKGLPTGLKINASTGEITGKITAKPGVYTFTTWSQNGVTTSAVVARMIVVQPFPSMMTGAFEGILLNEGFVPLGKVEVLVNSTGAFTGKLNYRGDLVIALKGLFTLNADITSATATVDLGGGAALALAIDRNNALTGSLTIPGSPTEVYSLTGGVKVGGYGTAQPAPWKGTYSMEFGDVHNYGSTEVPLPVGDGHAAGVIAPTGVLQVKGKLADGTALTGSFASDALGTYRAFFMPYKRVWSLVGGFWSLSSRGDQPTTYHVASGAGQDFYWAKSGGSTDKLYPAGFGLLGLNISVEPWSRPADLSALASKLGLGSGRTLTLLVSGDDLSNGGANAYGLPLSVTLAGSGTSVTLTGSGSSPLTAKVNLVDGSFVGSIKLAASGSAPARVVPIEGTLQQLVAPAAGSVVGGGSFSLPGVTKTQPTLVGLIRLSVPDAAP